MYNIYSIKATTDMPHVCITFEQKERLLAFSFLFLLAFLSVVRNKSRLETSALHYKHVNRD